MNLAQLTSTSYCIGPCTCGQNCHENTDLHTQITGALTSDKRTEEKPCLFPEDYDDDLLEIAIGTLGVQP